MSVKMNFIKSIRDKFVIGDNDTRVGALAVGLVDDAVLPLNVLESSRLLQSYMENNNDSLISIGEFLRPDVGKVRE